MGLFDFFRRRPPIRDARALADFIDEQAAFLVQKGIYEYSRARAGHYSKVLFREPEFQAAVEQSRWRAYPLGLAMVAELVDGVLRTSCGADRQRQLDALSALVLSVFDRYPVPAGARRAGLERGARRAGAPAAARSACIAPKRAFDIPRAVGRNLFRSDADPREAARTRFPDHRAIISG